MLSVILFLIMGVYAAQKLQVLVTMRDKDISDTKLVNYFDDRETITGKDGFHVAFAVLDFTHPNFELEDEYASYNVVS